MHRLQELLRLHRLGTACRDVARMLKMSPNTEKEYRMILKKAGLLEGNSEELPELEDLKQLVLQARPVQMPPQQTSSVQAWSQEVEQMAARGAKAKAIYDTLRLKYQEEFTGSYFAVKRMCKALRRKQRVSAQDVVIPVMTAPGEVAQVDFGYAGRLYDESTGQYRKCWFFVMVLGYSRHMFARLVFDQKTETWLKLHIEAFEHFAGVPQRVVPDNLKAAVIQTAFGVNGQTSLNRSYRELARYYGFVIEPTPPRKPQHKGKVESSVKYVKNNFLLPREPESVQQANQELDMWVIQVAGERIHGTTGKKPLEQFEQEERVMLRALPDKAFELVMWKEAKVHRDSHVQWEGKLYSVPFRYVGEKVWLKVTENSVVMYANDERIATHSRPLIGLKSTQEGHLPEHRALWGQRSREYWEAKAESMGESVLAYIQEVFAQDDVLSQLRQVQSIISHLEKFPTQRAQAACRRASHFGNYSYQGIKDILRKALDMEELEDDKKQRLETPQFARSMDDFLH